MAGVDVDTLTIEQYLAFSRENQAPSMVKPEIGGNVNFEIKSQFMRELREDTFFENKGEDAHDHIDRVLNIVGLFSIPGVSKDVVFIQRYCPLFMTAKQLEDIHNFKQEGDESLYQAWERYNDLLYKCPTYDINNHQKVNIFYKGLSTMNCQLLDSQGPIPGMRPTEALTEIQTMADHSQKWHDETTSRNIRSSSSKDRLAALVNKLDNLGRDLKKLKKSVHAIQVGCQIYEGPHLDKDCPLNEEVKQVEEVRYEELGRTTPFNGNNRGKFHVGPHGYYTKIDNRPPYGEKRQSLEELLAKHQEESARRSTEMEEKKSASTSKDAFQSQHKSSRKSAQAEEPSHTVEDSSMQQDQEFVTGDNDEQSADKVVTKADWFKKPERPPTPDPDWSKRRQVDFRPPQTWISQVAHVEEPPTLFDEHNDTSFDFSAS
ncbi:hypothetical protein Tco_0863898 [Tanacetum coccineum]